jgi:hypothetical protein
MADLGSRSRMLLDAAPNGANGGWVNGGYKDFAPTELGRQGLCPAWDITYALIFEDGTVSRCLRLYVWVVSSRDQGSRG